jgi:putative transposase/transposase-like zinc-binding protein
VCTVAAPATAVSGASRLELADIVRAHGDAYRQAHRLASVQDRALRAIATCRTAALGGHTDTCDQCGATRHAYNSCRNRHCPKCQHAAQAAWLAARQAELLPVPYFHVVFTLPHRLNALAQGNPRVLYAALFRAAADTLLTFGRDPRHLGGTVGITAILHTWGQNLAQHLHLHCVVTGGALAPDGTRWIAAKDGFLFPVRALSAVFRAKYLDALQEAFGQAQLTFAAGTADLAPAEAFARFVADLRTAPWVVYAKRPFGGPAHVLRYLGRYTHRVAISNARLVDLSGGTVRFRWKDYADGDRTKVMALSAEEFLRRFLLHVVPRGFVRIRYFGLLAHRQRRAMLDRCRAVLAAPSPAAPSPAPPPIAIPAPAADVHRCPRCGVGIMRVTTVQASAPPPTPGDTS